jgi:hypothetical protein
MTDKMNSSDPDDDHRPPGVPGFRSWRGVYLFVFGAFVLVVIGLTIFTRYFA